MSSTQQAKQVMPRTSCPDCETPMQEIKLIDRSVEPDRQLEYAGGDAHVGLLLGRFTVAGKVRARMCPACGRIILHGGPNRPE